MASRKSRTLIEHTADIGFKIRARSLRNLFTEAAEGLFDLVTDVSRLRRTRLLKTDPHKVFSLRAADTGELLLAWLRELLYYFSSKRYVFLHYQISKLKPRELKVRASGVLFDPRKDEQRYEVKAVTYHGFKCRKTKTGWTAEIIFDI